jgi:hypothetical protein
MKNKTKYKLKELKQKIEKDPSLKGEYEKDPALFLEKHGIDTDDLPPEILEKISGGLWWVAPIVDLFMPSSPSAPTNVNHYYNNGQGNTIISDSNDISYQSKRRKP